MVEALKWHLLSFSTGQPDNSHSKSSPPPPCLPITLNEDISGDRVAVRVQCGHAAANKDPEPGVVSNPDRRLNVDGITQEVDSRTPLIEPVTWKGNGSKERPYCKRCVSKVRTRVAIKTTTARTYCQEALN